MPFLFYYFTVEFQYFFLTIILNYTSVIKKKRRRERRKRRRNEEKFDKLKNVKTTHKTQIYKRFYHFLRITGELRFTTISSTLLRRLLLSVFWSIKYLKIERNYDTRRNDSRAYGAYIVYLSDIFKIDTFGDA
jgi:hypothetical protein